uniref:Ig-like domain-containing protein n=1 Tax=Branchiostoma floridae TaxID=7739 RepID=C3ZJL7_BRAFL|eukprot:XP_002591348.1 hypothetical protein BRAFLDRAFT_76818 [Branchiostoma floridae]
MGRSATLPCTGITNVFREWQRLDTGDTWVQLITLYTGGSTPDLQEKAGLDTFNLRGRFTATADDDFTATITNTRAIDDGRYLCDGSSSGGQIVHTLLTYYMNSASIQPDGPATEYIGGSIQFTCAADSKPAVSFNWTKQGDSSFTATGATLHISNLNKDDSGTYQCTAYHAYDSRTATVLLTVNEDNSQRIVRDITFKPYYAVTAQSTYTRKALTGSDVILPCDYDQTADGDWIIVTWTMRIGGTFQNLYVRTTGSTTNAVASPPPQFAGRMAIDGISNLRLTGVTIGDEDEYRCIVTAQTLSPVTFVNLQVFQQPTGPIVQVQFDPVTFTCTSTGGRPPASLGWSVTENGTPVSVNPTYTSSNNSQGVGDATSTFNFTTTKYGVTYRVQCTASGPDPIQSRTSAVVSVTTEKGGLSPGAQAGIGVGVALGCMAVAGVAAYFFVVKRRKRAGRDKDDGDARNPADRHYENVAHPDQRVASQPPGSGSDDEYDYEVPMETIQPPQPSDDYQELRPAIYQSLQKH